MATDQVDEIELLVSYFIRIHIHSKYSNLDIPPEIQQLIQQFAKKCIGSKLLTDTEEQDFMKLLLTQKTSLFRGKTFKLLYRGSENEYLAEKFHQLCDDKGPTLVIIQSEFGNIFGGYTSKSWGTAQCNHISDSTAFLFVNRRTDIDLDKQEIFNIKPQSIESAIIHIKQCGPVFGNGYSLKIADKCNKPYDTQYAMQSSYTWDGAYPGAGDICGKDAPLYMSGHFFSVIDYEVFSVQ